MSEKPVDTGNEETTPTSENAPAKGEPVIVKRYANRKLYNTNTSSYVTLSEIARMVRDGEDVRIVDYKTKRDITSVTLSQIVFENEKKQKLIPSQTLRDIIQSGGEVISEFIQRRVDFGGLKELKEEAERKAAAIEKLYHKGPFSREEAARLMRELFLGSSPNLEDLQKRVDERLKVLIGPLATPGLVRREFDALKAEVDLLSSKLEALERLLEEREKNA